MGLGITSNVTPGWFGLEASASGLCYVGYRSFGCRVMALSGFRSSGSLEGA